MGGKDDISVIIYKVDMLYDKFTWTDEGTNTEI